MWLCLDPAKQTIFASALPLHSKDSSIMNHLSDVCMLDSCSSSTVFAWSPGEVHSLCADICPLESA